VVEKKAYLPRFDDLGSHFWVGPTPQHRMRLTKKDKIPKEKGKKVGRTKRGVRTGDTRKYQLSRGYSSSDGRKNRNPKSNETIGEMGQGRSRKGGGSGENSLGVSQGIDRGSRGKA